MPGNKVQVLIFIEREKVWPTIKVNDHNNVEVIVVNNDRASIWKPEIIYEADEEVNHFSELADELKVAVDSAEELIKK